MLALVCMHTEHYLKASEINGKTSVDFRGCRPDVCKEMIREMIQGAATWRAWAPLLHGRMPKGNFHFGQKSAVFLPYRNSTAASFTKLFFPPAFLPISSMWKRNRKDILKMENSFPSTKPNLKAHPLLKNKKSGILYQNKEV